MRVVIAEDAAVLRAGLVQLLADRGYEVCAAVADGESLLAAVAAHHPHVTVVDVRMPPTYTDEGLRAAIQLRREYPETAVLVFSQYVETRYATRLLAESASGVGYLLKDRVADVAEFAEALARVAGGGTALDPEVVSQLLSASRQAASLDSLTRREREVLSLMAEGRSNAAIAAALVVSAGAVEKHVASIFAKLGLPPVRGRQPPGAGRAALPAVVTPRRRNHPFLTADAATYLAGTGAVLVGIDSLNIDDTGDTERPVHSQLLAAGIPICEHLTNLGALPAEGFRFSAVPPKLRPFGTFPVRAYGTWQVP